MPRLSANLTFLFGEHDFLDRFSAARAAGFRFVEFAWAYEYDPESLRRCLADNGLNQVLINLPAGDLAAGELGLAAHPDRIDEFRQGVARAVEYARVLGIPAVNCLVGRRLADVPYEDQRRVMVENLRFAAARLAAADRIGLLEPINSLDIPGYLIDRSQDALEIMDEVGASNLKLQYDVYHMQRMEGNLVETVRGCLTRIGHIQIADNPGRRHPGTGEINFRFLMSELDRMEYSGFVGLEYFPVPDTLSSLAWIKEYRLTL